MKILGIILFITSLVQVLEARELTKSDLDQLFAQQILEGRVMGLSVGIIQNGKLTTYHFGKTSKSGAVATDETKYETASITKLMTGTLMGFALNEGLLRETDLAQTYLQEFKLPSKEGAEITIRDLMTHRAGFDNGFWDTTPMADPQRPWVTFDKHFLIQYLADKPLAFVPGQNAKYDNIGVGLAGLILQNLYKTSYDDLLKQEVLKPLDMKDSGFYHSELHDGELAVSYRADEAGALQEVPPWLQRTYLQGLGGMHSSINDMAKFAKGVLETPDTNLAMALKTAMTQRLPSLAFPQETVGLLWRYRPEFGVYWHNGSTYGMNSFVALNLEKKVAVILLCNTDTHGVLTDAGFKISTISKRNP